MCCSPPTIKYILLLFNGACMCVSATAEYINFTALKGISEDARYIIISLMVIGAIAFVITFLGCYGAISTNKWVNWIYAIAMLLLIGFSIVLILVQLKSIDFEATAKQYVVDAFNEQKISGNLENSTMSAIQEKYECCGIDSHKDYNTKDTIVVVMPKSCFDKTRELYKDGCSSKVKNQSGPIITKVTLFGLILTGVMSACFVFATSMGIQLQCDQSASSKKKVSLATRLTPQSRVQYISRRTAL